MWRGSESSGRGRRSRHHKWHVPGHIFVQVYGDKRCHLPLSADDWPRYKSHENSPIRFDTRCDASRVKILHGFCGRRSNKKSVKCGYFLFKRKNRVSTVSKRRRRGGKSEKRNSPTYRENIKQEISRAKICMQVKSRKQDVNAAADGCDCVLRCVLCCVCVCVKVCA